MSLAVSPVSANFALVDLKGFQPDEKVDLIFYFDGQNIALRSELNTVLIGPDGAAVFNQGLQPTGFANSLWHVQVVHSRGVACTQVEMP